MPTALKQGDQICFGVNLDTNELKYTLTSDHGRHILRKCTAGGHLKQRSSQRAPDVGSKDKEPSNKDSEKETRDVTPDLTPPVSPLAPPVPPREKQGRRPPDTDAVEARRSFPSHTGIGASQTSTPVKRPPSSIVNPTLVKKPRILDPSPVRRTPRTPVNPSPGTQSSTSELRIEDELFPEDNLKEDEDPLAQLFGNVKPDSTTLKHLGSDATSIQIQIAKDEMEKEKHKLLSSIEALKSELMAKEQLLVDKEEEDKAKQEKSNSSMMSSMQEEFTCVICQELFVSAYTLPCAHSYCEWCIKEWMKGKKRSDCPICRKMITSEPVHSLALDNAISKLVEKLDSEAKAEREEVIKSYTESLKGGFTSSKEKRATASTPVTATPTSRATGSGPTTSGVTTRRMAGLSATAPIVIETASPSRASRGRVTITVSDSDDSEDSENSDDDSDDSEDSDSYDGGVVGAYYGGYGRCFRCGKLSYTIGVGYRLSLWSLIGCRTPCRCCSSYMSFSPCREIWPLGSRMSSLIKPRWLCLPI